MMFGKWWVLLLIYVINSKFMCIESMVERRYLVEFGIDLKLMLASWWNGSFWTLDAYDMLETKLDYVSYFPLWLVVFFFHVLGLHCNGTSNLTLLIWTWIVVILLDIPYAYCVHAFPCLFLDSWCMLFLGWWLALQGMKMVKKPFKSNITSWHKEGSLICKKLHVCSSLGKGFVFSWNL